ncbi:MAG TPA: hypothetical protein VGX23_33620 [Actinocrinis sp.]|nr:hypothetical protein [Actinocrinis sp.]
MNKPNTVQPATDMFTRPFPTCAPWCSGEHWDGETEDDPGTCFAEDVSVPFGAGTVEAAMSFGAARAEGGKPDVSVTVFLPSRDIIDGLGFTDLAEAEVVALVLLAQLAVARGDQAMAEHYKQAAEVAALRTPLTVAESNPAGRTESTLVGV